jgi:hypothetical protein
MHAALQATLDKTLMSPDLLIRNATLLAAS